MATIDDASPTDEELFKRWAAGDQPAGQHLFRRHFDPLLRFFRHQLGDAGPDLHDLVQQTFLGCVQARARHPELSNFRAFLFAIARNQLYKHLRRRSGLPVHILAGSSVADLYPSPSRLLGDQEERALLIDALTQLPLEQQLAIYFYYIVGLTAPQTAVALGGLREPAVRSRLRRALVALGKRLDPARTPPSQAFTRALTTLEDWESKLPTPPPGAPDDLGPDEIALPDEKN